MTTPDESPFAAAHAILLLDHEATSVLPFAKALGASNGLPEDVPLPRLGMNVIGVRLDLSVFAAPLQSKLLDFALANSPVRSILEPAVAAHRSHLLVLAAREDPFRVQQALTPVVATLASGDGVTAVLLPHQEAITTDVLYAGETQQRPALTWFRTNAAAHGDGMAAAFTRGLWALGGTDVVLWRVPCEPAQAFRELRGAVATLLEAGRLPREGDVMSVAGASYALTPGVDPIDGRAVLISAAAA